jgi:hypothetical protein
MKKSSLKNTLRKHLNTYSHFRIMEEISVENTTGTTGTGDASSRILTLTFNQEHSTFSTGTSRGFAVYRTFPLCKFFERDMGGAIGIIAPLGRTQYFGLVGAPDGAPKGFPVNKFVLWDDQKKKVVAFTEEGDRIVGLKLNDDVAAVLTRRYAILYSLTTMKPVMNKIKTFLNPRGVCALSSTKNANYFLCPGPEPGTVNIVDYAAGTERIVNCHRHPLRTLSLNSTDTNFATTSETGTLVRVYELENQTLLKELRRGSDTCEIYSADFSTDAKCLSATSSKGTVHVYGLHKDFGNRSSWMMGEYSAYPIPFALPAMEAPTTANQPTSAVGGPQFHTPAGPVRHIACLTVMAGGGGKQRVSDSYNVLIVSEDGTYAVHSLQFKDGKVIPKTSGRLEELPAQTPQQNSSAENIA